jgi:hypothetical protein
LQHLAASDAREAHPGNQPERDQQAADISAEH